MHLKMTAERDRMHKQSTPRPISGHSRNVEKQEIVAPAALPVSLKYAADFTLAEEATAVGGNRTWKYQNVWFPQHN
jgi:hypothetical protein